MTDSITTRPANHEPKQNPQTGVAGTLLVPDMLGILGLVAILAISTSFLFFQHFHDFYSPDSASYVVPAGNILAGYGFVNSAGYPETERTPGYSLFILPFLWMHLDLKYLIIFQHLARALIVLGATIFAFRVTRSSRAALLTGVLLSLDLPFLESANSVLTEILFTATLAVVVLLLWTESGESKKPGIYCFTAGLLAGASALIRPVNMLFFVPATLYLLLVRRSFNLRAAVTFSLAFVILPLSWAIRNYHETGYFGVSTISGEHILLYGAAGALAINDSGDFSANLERRQVQLQAQACDDIRTRYGTDCSQVTIPRKSEYDSVLGRTIIGAHPFAYAKVLLRGDAEMILGGGLVRLRKMTGTSAHVGMILMLICTIPVFCFASMGLLVLWKNNRGLSMLILLVIFYFLAISGGPGSDSRFRVPVVPLYAFAAAVGLDFSLKRLLARNELTRSLATDSPQVRNDQA
jgi:4-amino-4-deoxy-L-arabinose transferase-like glycosyltransferase